MFVPVLVSAGWWDLFRLPAESPFIFMQVTQSELVALPGIEPGF
jgi:hypothetical protein